MKVAIAGVALIGISVAVSKAINPQEPAIRPATTLALPVTTTAPIPAPGTTQVPPLSEADLLAVDQDAVRQALVGTAEWFLTEYFTVDGTSVNGEALGGLAPSNRIVRGDSERSFVEAVSILSVDYLGTGEFKVRAVVHSLSSVGEGYQRLSPRGVELRLSLTDEGPEVRDLPRPVELELPATSLPEVEPEELPSHIAEAALRSVTPWGTAEPGSMIGGRIDGGWRVEVTVRDDVGVPWPVALWVDSEGRVLDARS